MTTYSTLPPVKGRRDTARSFSTTATLILAATALVGVPTLALAAPASAATTLSVLTPTEGSTVNYVAPSFSGEGVTAGDTVSLTYAGVGNPRASATKYVGDPTIAADLTWSTPTNFDELAPGQTTITVTATEMNGSTIVGTPVIRTFSTDRPTNAAYPFAVSSPTTLAVITTPTPTATGSASPGDTITVTYGKLDATVVTAGTAVTGVDGSFSATLDLSGVELNSDGTLNNLGLTFSRTSSTGAVYADSALTVTVQYRPAAVTPPVTTPPVTTPVVTTPVVTTPAATTPVTVAAIAPVPVAVVLVPVSRHSAVPTLPVTGTNAAPTIGVGSVLLAIGAALLVIRRRRSIQSR